jgi:hypothetical protein
MHRSGTNQHILARTISRELFVSEKDQVSEGNGCHGLDYDWSTESEADIVTARNLEGIHFACREVEGLLGFADA